MKKMFLIISLSVSSAMASTGQIGSGSLQAVDVKDAIEKSKQFKAIQRSYNKVGGSFKCSNYQVVADTDLQASLNGYVMTSKSVVADCEANPNDGSDAISQRLLSIVTVKENAAEKWLAVEVQSAVTVTPPQPD